jgi:hypothetical protein
MEKTYALQDLKTKKFVSMGGYCDYMSDSTSFGIESIKNRFGISSKAKNEFVQAKVKELGFLLVPLFKTSYFTLEGGGGVLDDDILLCEAEYYKDDIVTCRVDRVVYCKARNIIRVPKGKFVEDFDKIIFKVKKVDGKAII